MAFGASSAYATPPDPAVKLRDTGNAAMDKGDFAAAKDAYQQLAALNPADFFNLYNLACARAMLHDDAGAGAALTDAVSRGFIDFWHMEHDAQLASIRGGADYQRILAAWPRLIDARGDFELAQMRQRFPAGPPPKGYEFQTDAKLRLHFASAFSQASFADAREQIERVYKWTVPALFPASVKDDPRPDPWVAVVLPNASDFAKLVSSERVGGYYDRDRRRLVTQDIGPSLRHEFFHVLHWRDMDRRGQVHPDWLVEGMACVLEDVDYDAKSGFIVRPSWRTNIARRLAKRGALTPWPVLFKMPNDRFMQERASANYAQSRAICMYLCEKGKLAEWYAAFTAAFAQDPSGLAATETVFKRSVSDVEKDFRAWLLAMPDVAEQSRPAELGLGVVLDEGVGDGVVVTNIVAGSRQARGLDNPLRQRDVVTAIEGHPIRSLDDYQRVMGDVCAKQTPKRLNRPPATPLDEPDDPLVGEPIKVTVRRGGKEMTLKVTPVEPIKGVLE